MIKRLSTIICLFLFCGLWQSMLSYGEKKEGHIISSDGAPIMDVLVTVINNADSTTLCMTSTDNKGIYLLDLPDNYNPNDFQLHTLKKGYENFSSTISSIPDPIRLQKLSEELPELEVKSKKPSMKPVPGGMRYNPHELYGIVKDAKALLRKVPMLEVGSNSINIFSKEQTAIVYVNGNPINYSLEVLQEWLAKMPPKSIKGIEIIFDPGATYSSSVKKGGIINIILENYLVGHLSGINSSVSYENEKFSDSNTLWSSYQNGRVMVSGSITNRDQAMNLKYNKTTKFTDSDTSTEEELYSKTDRHTLSGNLGAKWYITTKTFIGVNANLSGFKDWSRDRSNIYSVTETLRSLLYTTESQNQRKFGKPNGGVGITFGTNFKYNWGLRFDGGYFVSSQTPYVFLSEYNYHLDESAEREKSFTQINNSYGNSANFRLGLGKGFKTPFRLDFSTTYSYMDYQYEMINNGEEEEFRYKEGIFSQAIETSWYNSRFTVSAGVSLEITNRHFSKLIDTPNFDKVFINILPDISASMAINSQNNLRLSYSMGKNRPDISSLSPVKKWTSATEYTVGNPALKGANSHSINLRYGYGSLINLSLSSIWLNDLPVATFIPGKDGILISTNIPGVSYQGILADINIDKWLLNNYLHLKFSASYCWAESYSNNSDYTKTINNSFSCQLTPSVYLNSARDLEFYTFYSYIMGDRNYTTHFPDHHIIGAGLQKTFNFGLECRLSYKQNLNQGVRKYSSLNYITTSIYYFENKPRLYLSISYRFGNTKVIQAQRNNAAEMGGGRMTF